MDGFCAEKQKFQYIGYFELKSFPKSWKFSSKNVDSATLNVEILNTKL